MCVCVCVSRCLASETECEKLRERANELRRKVEDTQAALLELGRENQSLQVTTVQYTWMSYLSHQVIVCTPVRYQWTEFENEAKTKL